MSADHSLGNTKLPNWLRLALLLIAVANFWRIADRPLDAHRAVDFRNVYLGQLLLWEGQNPYDDSRLKARWQELAQAEGLEPESEPGFPDNPLLYPPWALSVFLGWKVLPFAAATTLWYILSLGMLLLAVRWAGAERMETFLDMLLIALAFKGTVHAWIVGQPTFLCFALLMGAWHFYRKGRIPLAGLLLGLAAFKPTLAAPLLLLMLFNRQWRLLAWAAAIGAAAWALALLLSGDPVAMHLSLADNVRHFQEILFDPTRPDYPLYFTMTQITESGVLLEYFSQGAAAFRSVLYLLTLVPAIAWLAWRKGKGRIDDLSTLTGLFLIFFLGTYHQFYDLLPGLLLLPFWAKKCSRTEKILLLLALAPLFLPVNGVLNQFSLPGYLNVLYFSTPLSVLVTSILFFRREIVDSLSQ